MSASNIETICTVCNHHHLNLPDTITCNRCNAALKPVDGYLVNPVKDLDIHASSNSGVWKYRDLYPGFIENSPVQITLGEQTTPILELTKWGGKIQLPGLITKLESVQPTGSFKDRGAAVMLSWINHYGHNYVIEDSSGNAGASLAAYAARASIKTTIFAPQSTSNAKADQIRSYGANLVEVKGGRKTAADAALQQVLSSQSHYASHALHPLFVSGMASFLLELHMQLGEMPDHLICPVGNGSLILGSYAAANMLINTGRSAQPMPRLHCIQSKACAPIVTAYKSRSTLPATVNPRDSIATGLSVSSPKRGPEVLAAIYGSQGVAISVKEDEIMKASSEISSMEGVYLEPSASVAFAGLKHLAKNGVISKNDLTVIVSSGHGLKSFGYR
tara:strand:- start:737 stop:1903 length:1167 start_codon:yes stop_codon:yes gene_type:complete